MPSRAFIVPGFKATPRSSWFPSLAERFSVAGIETTVLAMPHPWIPALRLWVRTIENAVGKPDQDTFLIGHSTGAIAILRYVESLPPDAHLGGIVLVSGFPARLAVPGLTRMLMRPVDSSRVRGKVGWVLAIHSSDDWRVPLINANWHEHEIGAEVILLPGAGHIVGKSGFWELPESLVERMIDQMCSQQRGKNIRPA